MVEPKKFVSLHNHTGFSAFDGLGYPNEHFEFAEKNGLTAHAITEHGQFNSYAHAQLFIEDWQKSGKMFRYLPGVEAYFHPDLSQWAIDKENAQRAKEEENVAKKLRKKEEELQTKLIASVDEEDEALDVETNNQLTIENEEETKQSTKFFNPVNRRHHLVLLAKNSQGLQELFHLTSRSFLEGFYRFPRIDVAMLKDCITKGNVVASSACIGGFAAWSVFNILQRELKFDVLDPKLLDDKHVMRKCVAAVGNVYDMMIDVFGKDDYFLELQFNKLGAQDVANRAILEFAKQNNVQNRLVVTCDAHYYNPDVWRERELYKKLGFMNYKEYSPDSLPKSVDDLKCELYPKNVNQVWDEFKKSKDRCSWYKEHEQVISDAIEYTHTIAHEVIGEVKPDRTIKLPKKLVPKDRTPDEHLKWLCIEGMKKRGLKGKKEYVARLKEELDVISFMQMSEYFITLARICDLGRNVCLFGPARGSGGGSLVNYILYITDLDPIVWNLPFSRFMARSRVGIPDIDTDVADRDKVLDVMRAEFGYNNVVPISNYNVLKVKSLLKDLSKFYGVPFEEANIATRTVETEVRKATLTKGSDKNLFLLTFDDAMKHSASFRDFMDKHPEVAQSMKILFKQNRSLSRHAGGVLVCDDLPKKMPLITSKGEPQSSFVEGVNVKHLEKIGSFVKYDILGLNTLRIIERTIELILTKNGVKNPTFQDVKQWFDENLAVGKIDLSDQSVYEYVYHSGRWCAVFQCTSTAAQRFFIKGQPRSILDIAMLTSIFRPGPLAANVDDLYLRAKNDGEQYDWGDKRINELLKDTYGLLIFQEGVMLLAEKVAGFPKDKCDDVRRAIMKRSISGGDAAKAKVDAMKSEFVEGAIKNGYTESVASSLYEKIAFFSGYAFNASHATGYAIDSYWCAWLLKHHEIQWLTAYLESSSHTPDARAEAFGEIKKMGYKIVPIDVNHATTSWTSLPGKKFMPSFLSCKGVGDSAAQEILEHRPYASIEDVLWNEDGSWKHSKFNKRALEALIRIGGLSSLDAVGEGKLFSSWKQMHYVLIERQADIKKTSKRDPGIGRRSFYEIIAETASMEEWTAKERAENMVEVFGSIDVSALVEQTTIDALAQKGVLSIDEASEEKNIFWFVVNSCVKKQTKAKKPYLLINALGPVGKSHRLNVWGWKEASVMPDVLSLCVAEIEKNEMGMSTVSWKLKIVS